MHAYQGYEWAGGQAQLLEIAQTLSKGVVAKFFCDALSHKKEPAAVDRIGAGDKAHVRFLRGRFCALGPIAFGGLVQRVFGHIRAPNLWVALWR